MQLLPHGEGVLSTKGSETIRYPVGQTAMSTNLQLEQSDVDHSTTPTGAQR